MKKYSDTELHVCEVSNQSDLRLQTYLVLKNTLMQIADARIVGYTDTRQKRRLHHDNNQPISLL